MKSESFLFEAATPCAEPVDLAALLTDIEAVIRRHVILGEHAAAALAVWVLHTYTFELRDAVAYVAIESPEKRCGKTTLVSVLAAMAHKPLIASNITVGALFRAIDTCRPTLFIDEADTFLAGNGTMRGIINSGNTWRTAYVLRLSRAKSARKQSEPDIPTPGTEHGFKRYSCWCPKVIALIGEVPDTIADRSIVVKMSRKLTSEQCAPLAGLDTRAIRSQCARFALDAGPHIAASEKIRGQGLNDRAADTFDPLYVIARLAGADWESKLDAAAHALTASPQTDNPRTELLLDILNVLVETGSRKIFSRDLVFCLRDGPPHLKSSALKSSEFNEQSIARILRNYGIRPTALRIGTEVNRGYLGTDFREALLRYVPKAELDGRLEEMCRRSNLWAEARAEAKANAEKRAADVAMKSEDQEGGSSDPQPVDTDLEV